MASRLEFWFDFASTYSYLGAVQIEEKCKASGVSLEWKPFALGPIFQLQGWNDSHFNLNPRRGAYMWRDMERQTRKLGLPWRRPSLFPRNSILADRVACSIAAEPWAGSFIRAVFEANFGNDLDIAERSTIENVLKELGQPPTLVDRALNPPYDGLLRKNTTRAIELGIFGAPNCIVSDELFWGEEALDDAVELAAR